MTAFLEVDRLVVVPQTDPLYADLKCGTMSIGGDYYNHVVVACGFGGKANNPLSNFHPHQVCFYAALTGNDAVNDADGFVSGFETGLWVDCGGSCKAAVSFQVGAIGAGVGSTITYTRGLGTHDETVGTNNAAIADNGIPFTGNWFIYYGNARPSYLGGALTVAGVLTIGAGKDLVLPGGGFGIQNDFTRFLAVASGASPLTTFNYAVQVSGAFGCNTKTPQTAFASGGAAPAGGTGTTAGAYDTASNRNALITLVNNMRTALVNNGIMS